MQKRQPNRRRRGSALVEAALATLPLMAFLFGIFDVAFAIFVKNTLAFAVRQGVRYAVTSQTMSGMGQDMSIKTTVINSTIGLLNSMSPGGNGANQITITYYDPSTLQPVTGVNSNVGGNIVLVSASGLSWAWMFPLWRTSAPLQFSAASADIMEATPIGGPPPR
jgi:Flp pilus assembly protein TadG